MEISDKYWAALEEGSQGAQFSKIDLMAANAVLLMDRQQLKEKLTEHASMENHGDRWIRLVANEIGPR